MTEYYLVVSVLCNIILFITMFLQHDAISKFARKADMYRDTCESYRKLLQRKAAEKGEDNGY